MRLVVIVGESGGGKSTLQRALCDEFGWERVVSCTTRQPRRGEKDGISYKFLSREEFDDLERRKKFFEVTEYDGEKYGTLRQDLFSDNVRVMVRTPSGAKALKEVYGNGVFIVYLQVDAKTRIGALRLRGEKEEVIQKRVAEDRVVFKDAERMASITLTNRSFKMLPNCLANLVGNTALKTFADGF